MESSESRLTRNVGRQVTLKIRVSSILLVLFIIFVVVMAAILPVECQSGFQKETAPFDRSGSDFMFTPCQGQCPKVCKGLLVTNIETAQTLRGCTTIDDDLEIQIKAGDNIIQELEKNLGSIEEIRGVLKIIRSSPIVSLGFFKSLRTIRGESKMDSYTAQSELVQRLNQSGHFSKISKVMNTFFDVFHPTSRKPPFLSRNSSNASNSRYSHQMANEEPSLHFHQNKYALIVHNNQNLQQLWPKTQNLTIHEKVLFHFNPKLCFHSVEELVVHSTRVPQTEVIKHFDSVPWSNGIGATCNEQVFNPTVVSRTADMMLLSLNNFKATLNHNRHLLGYNVVFIEASQIRPINVSYYNRHDSIDRAGRKIKQKNAVKLEVNPKENEVDLLHLKPYTQYAIYVQANVIAPQHPRKRIVARSPIMFERTNPAKPDKPKDLRAYSNSVSELTIEWKPPPNPNGIVTHYTVIGTWSKSYPENFPKFDVGADRNPSFLSIDRNRSSFHLRLNSFYDYKMRDKIIGLGNQKLITGLDKPKFILPSYPNLMLNPSFSGRLKPNAIPRPRIGRIGRIGKKKRQVGPTTDFSEYINNGHVKFVEDKNTFRYKVTGTSYTVVGLRNYVEYTIKVMACHDRDPISNRTLCSETAVTSARTKQLDFADDIVGGVKVKYASTNSNRSIKISWKEPKNPNGLIVKYVIKYRREDVVDSTNYWETRETVVEVCQKDFVKSNWTEPDLIPGNYCVQVQAISWAGSGSFTAPSCFVIKGHLSLFRGKSAIIFGSFFIIVVVCVFSVYVWHIIPIFI